MIRRVRMADLSAPEALPATRVESTTGSGSRRGRIVRYMYEVTCRTAMLVTIKCRCGKLLDLPVEACDAANPGDLSDILVANTGRILMPLVICPDCLRKWRATVGASEV